MNEYVGNAAHTSTIHEHSRKKRSPLLEKNRIDNYLTKYQITNEILYFPLVTAGGLERRLHSFNISLSLSLSLFFYRSMNSSVMVPISILPASFNDDSNGYSLKMAKSRIKEKNL